MTPALHLKQIDVLRAINKALPQGTRLFVNGEVVVITLGGPDIKPGVPDTPSDTDIDASIGQLQALKRVGAKLRAEAKPV